MILKNVELRWVRLDPENPDNGFDGNTPQWNLQALTRDKKQADDWKTAGLNPKPDQDDQGIFYKVTTKKLTTGKNGEPNKPVPVVGRDRMPIQPELLGSIGNGSIGNVKIRTYEWSFGGKTGIGQRLEAVQIVKLVEYKSAGSKVLEGFEEIDADDTSVDDDDAY